MKIRPGTPGFTFGKVWGLNVCQTWTKVLLEAKQHKWTDHQILRIMREEFPERKSFEAVYRIRSYYNCGKMNADGKTGYGFGQKLAPDDPRFSRPYDSEGNAVQTKGGNSKRRQGLKKLYTQIPERQRFKPPVCVPS